MRGRAALGLLVLGGCAGVVGLDDYRDALSDACECAAGDVGLGAACAELAEERFVAAGDATARAWLATFAGCAGCGDMQTCWETAPFCAGGGSACVASEQCCAHATADRAGCLAGACGTCVDCANFGAADTVGDKDLCDDVPAVLRACVEACGINPLCKDACFKDQC